MAPEAAPLGAKRLPTTIGGYEILSPLGQGGMARVYLALKRGAFASQKLVVIKQLRPEFVSDEAFLTMFMDEARIALQLHHPNVVHTYEVGTDGGDYYLSMEFLEGLTLAQIVRKAGRDGLPLPVQLWILTQVLAGLGHAHELRGLDGEPLGIVHRDVSPSNVMVTSSGEVKLLDFGIAKAAGALSLTQQGTIKGKLGYVSPEQCLGKPCDARSDLFAVGVMLWEAIAGRRRVAAETSAAAFEARIQDREPAIEEVVPTVAPRLAEICRRALAREPQHRYSSAAHFRADLEEFLDSNYTRVGASKLAAQMVQLFTDEFTALRLRIEQYVQANPSQASEPAPRSGAPDSTLSMHEPSGPKRNSRAIFGAAVAAVGIAGAVWTITHESPPAPGSASSATLASASASAPAVVENARPAASSPPIRTHVSVVAFPKQARLFLDGREIANPFSAELPRDELGHELEVTAAGYQSEQRLLSLKQDVQLVLELKRGAAVTRIRRPVDRPQPPLTREISGADGTHASATPAPSPARPAPAATPGEELRAGTRAPRSIDEKDLYQ